MRRYLCLGILLVALVLPTIASSAPPAHERKARLMVTLLSSGDFDAVRVHFSPGMTAAMKPGALAKLWAQIVRQAGAYGGIVGVRSETRGEYKVVTVTTSFSTAPLDVRLVFDSKLLLSGLRFTAAAADGVKRPQTPKPPFPYESTEVTFTNPKDGTVFAGTLTVPKGKGPFPTALLVTGSGPQDRDETIFGHKPFWVIADHLTREGIAVLRVDDRGAGKTRTKTSGATVEDHATDAEAALAFLRKNARVDKRRMGIIGHSEGGIIGAMVAGRTKDLGFLISLAGPGVSGAEINAMQVAAALRARKTISEEKIAKLVAAQKKLMHLVATDAPVAKLRVGLAEATRIGAQIVGETVSEADVKTVVDREVATLTSPWFRSFVKADPRKHFPQVRCPVLMLIGEKDFQVPPGPNLKAAREALAAGGNTRVELVELKGLNHLFQHAKTGLLDEYGKLTETFDPATLARMSRWIRKVAK